MCELLGGLRASMFMVLFIYVFNIVNVFFDPLYLIVIENKELSRDNNDELIVKEIELQDQREMLFSGRHC